MVTEFKVADVNCVDDSSMTRGVAISCSQIDAFVTLIFDKAVPHKQTDELAALLRNMKLAKVLVQTPDSKVGVYHPTDMRGI
jgi:hypothetical protein